MARWSNLNAWLNDPNIKGILNDTDHFNTRFMGTDASRKAYESLVNNGAKMHQLSSALGRYQDLVRQFGFGRPEITEIGHGSYQIVFYPTDSSMKLDAVDCPSLVINATSPNGVTVNQSLPSINLPVWTRAKNGQVGLTSALAAGIDDAITDLQHRFDYLKRNQGDMKSLGRSIYRATRNSITAVTHHNPAITTSNQSQDFREAISLGNVNDLRREAIAAMSGQTLTSFYNRSLYEQHKGKMYGGNAPKNERDFYRKLEDLKNGSRNYSDIKSLSNYVRQSFPWIYQNIWKGDLENLYAAAYSVGVKQGTKKEGAPGIISLFDVPTPGSIIAPLASNKPAKNLRLYQKTAAQAKNKSGSNFTFTKRQQSLYTAAEMKKQSHVKPLYYTGTLTDKDIMAAAMDMIGEGKKVPLDALKGVTADGSVYAAQIISDFRNEVARNAHVSQSIVQARLREKAEKFLAKNKDDALKTIDDVLAKNKNNWTKNIIAKELGVDQDNFQGEPVLENGRYTVGVKNVLSNPTFTARGGATMDLRTVTSPMMNELLGRAFIKHGYSEKQVWNDDGSLRMVIGTGAKELKGKTMWSDINGVYQYIVSELRNNSGKSTEAERNKHAVDVLQEDPVLKQIVSYDEKKGNIIFDNIKYQNILASSKGKVLGTTGEGSRSLYGTAGMLKTLIDFAQKKEIGHYQDQAKYYEEVGDNFKLLKPLMMATEFGRSSGVIYQGDFSNKGSSMHFSSKELESLQGTLGKMRYLDAEGKYTEEIGIFDKAIQGIVGEMQQLSQPTIGKDGQITAPGYNSYQKNVNDMRSFQKSVQAARKDLAESGLILTEEDLIKFSTELGYDGASVYSTNGKDLAIAEIKRLREKRYEALKTAKGEDWLKARGINNAFDIAVGLDTGDRRYEFIDQSGKSHIGGLAMLGVGNPEEAELYDENGQLRKFAYTADDIDKANNTIIKGYMALMASGRDDRSTSRYAGLLIGSGVQDIKKSILEGSIYDKMHKLEMKGSGYLLMQSMNTEIGQHAKELFGNDINPSYVLSTKDANTLLSKMSDTELNELYKSVFGNQYEKTGDKKGLIKKLISGMTLGDKNFKGVGSSAFMTWRSPTLKMFDDILGGGIVFSDSVTAGNYLVNPDAAAVFKGDFDGDRIAFFQALESGDIAAAQSILEDYFKELTESQKNARLSKSEKIGQGSIKEMNSVLNKEEQMNQASATSSGAKGAGIYGNLLYGISNGLTRSGLSFSSVLDSNSDVRGILAANMARALAGTFYQDGIAIKNTKARGDNPAAVLDDIMYRIQKGGIWNNYEGLVSLLTVADNAGILSENGVFKKNVMANAGLFNSNLMRDEDWAYYADMARQAANSSIFKNNKKGKAALLKEAKTFDNKTATNFSKELVSYIISSSEEGGLNFFLNKSGQSIGNIVSHLYDYIDGHSSDAWRVTTNDDERQAYDEETKAVLALWGDTRAEHFAKMEKDKSLSITDWATDPANSWANLNLDFIKKAKQKNLLGSPHSVDNYLLGINDDPNKTNTFNKALDQIVSSNGEIPISEILPKEEASEFVKMMSSSLKGTMIHAFQEIFTNALLDGTEDITDENISKILANNPEFQIAQKRLISFLKANGLSNISIQKELEITSNRAKAQTENFLDATGFSLKEYNQKKKQSGRQQYANMLIGTEMVLPGQFGKFHTTGALDVGSIKDGILTITDYKNTKNGTLNVADMLQNLQYVNFLKTWKENIGQEGAPNAEAYFKSNPDNPYVQAFKESFGHMAGQQASRALRDRKLNGETIEDEDAFIEEFKSKFIEEQYKKIYRLYDAVLEASDIRGVLQYTSETGVLRRYGINPDDRIIRGVLAKAYHTGNQISEEEQNLLIGQAREESPVQFSYQGKYAEDLKKYISLREQLLKVDKDIYLIDQKIEHAKQIGDGNLISSLTLDRETLLSKQKESSAEELKARQNWAGMISRGIQSGGNVSVEARAAATEYADSVKKLEEYYNKEKADLYFQENIVPGYKNNREQKTSLLRKKGELEYLLNNPLLKADEKEAYETEVASTEKKLQEVNENLSVFSKIVSQLDEVLPGISEIFSNLKATSEKKAEETLKQDELKRTREAGRRQRTEELKLSREVDSAVKGVNGGNFSVWELNQRIATTKDPLTKQFLETEREARLELLQMSQDRLEQIKDEYRDKNGNTNPAFQAILDKSQKKADLEYQIRTNEYLAKKGPQSGSNNGILGSIGGQVGSYFQRMLAGGAIYRAIAKIRQEIQKIINQSKELDKVMTNVRIVTNGSMTDTRNLMSEYSGLAKELGVTTKEVAQSGIEWMRQGNSIAESNKLIKASLYLSKLGMIDSTQATKALTSALKGFKLEAAEAMDVVDKLTAIDLKAATSAGDIAEGLAQFANLGSLAGVDINQAAAYVATISDVTQMSGSSAGQALDFLGLIRDNT